MWILTAFFVVIGGVGVWSLPSDAQRNTSCSLNPDPSVLYKCVLPDGSGTRPCAGLEPDGTVVKPECNTPNYYYSGHLSYMRCVMGSWDYVARCIPECGLITPDGIPLTVSDTKDQMTKVKLPWHASIYKKNLKDQQICSGSLVTSKVVISAAHCFWNELKQSKEPESSYAVALGTTARQWPDPDEIDIQRSDVEKVDIPPHFRGSATQYQSDLAILQLVKKITFTAYIRPVCINFDVTMQNMDLVEGNSGKVASWAGPDGSPSKFLQTASFPYIPVEKCFLESPVSFRAYITADKICAGGSNGSHICRGDGGTGLAFPSHQHGIDRYYLRGVASLAIIDEGKICSNQFATFTQVSKLEDFIKAYL